MHKEKKKKKKKVKATSKQKRKMIPGMKKKESDNINRKECVAYDFEVLN